MVAAALALASLAAVEHAPAIEGVYLLAFYRDGEHTHYPAMRERRRCGALHYAGYASDIRERLREHVTGRGNPLCRAAVLAGYELRLVRTWPGKGRDYERRLKDRHNLAAFCPDCRYRLASDPRPDAADQPARLWAETPRGKDGQNA